MKILSIETSCDETAIAILDISGDPTKPEITILGNSLLSQIDIHKEYGGVFPMLAKREHEKNLPILLQETLKKAGMSLEHPDIDYIAVTAGPGLEPALWTGISFAESLGHTWNKRVIPVNHMEGHIFSVLFDIQKQLEFPALALLVSGGHTELVLLDSPISFRILGKTRDDAVGEAFDKAARIIGLSYPGGPKISLLAAKHRAEYPSGTFTFPRPMIHSKDLDFSFSGLKTAVLYKTREFGDLTDEKREEIARAFEDAAIDTLISKTRAALEETFPKALIVAGGVSANTYLRSRLEELRNEFPDITLLLPSKELSTDNAIMIGIAAYVRTILLPDSSSEGSIQAKGNLSL